MSKSLFLISALAFTTVAAPQKPNPAEIAKQIKDRFFDLRMEGGFPGVNVAFVTPDGKVHTVSVGVSDMETSEPLKPDHKMLAGSVGKTFFAAGLMKLIEEGKAELDMPVAHWFRDESWFGSIPNAEDLSVRMLMTHTSGISDHVRNPKLSEDLMAQPDRVWTGPELLGYIPTSEAVPPAGDKFEYADTNYVLLAMIMDKALGQSAYSAIDKWFLKPLKLGNTTPSTSRTISKLAVGYARPMGPFTIEGRMVNDGKLVFNPQMEWGGGGFASTAEDLAKWAWNLYGGKAVTPGAVDRMLDAVEANTGPKDKYGLGVMVRESAWGTSLGHDGWFPGYLTGMEYFPDKKIAVAVMFNTDDMRKLKMGTRRFVAEVMKIVAGPGKEGE